MKSGKNENKRCVIISALIEGYGAWIEKEAKGAFVMCADGGYAFAKELGIKADLLIGDFDSYDGEMPSADEIEIIRVSSIKDDTDTGLCLKEALDRGYTDITMIGGIGGRLSHTIANIQSMAAVAKKTKKVVMADGLRRLTVLHGPATMTVSADADFPERLEENEKKHFLSLFAAGGECTGVSINGVFYPLDDAVLTSDYPLGVSNELTAPEATISVKKGTLVVIAE